MSKEDTIILQPEYVKGFQCDGSKCNAKCCRTHWRIDIDIYTYKKYQRIKKNEIKKKILSGLEANPNRKSMNHIDAKSKYMITKFNADGACQLLCSDNLCYIQRNLGVEALSLTCQIYPRIVRHVGNCQLRILSMTCPVAAEAALFAEHGMDIKNILSAKDDGAWKLALQIKKYIKLEDKDSKMAANVILGGLSILQNTIYTREQRLAMLGFFMDKADDLKKTSYGTEAIAELAVFYNGEAFKQQMENLFTDWTFYPVAQMQLLTGILLDMQTKRGFTNRTSAVLLKQVRDYEEDYKKYHTLMESEYGEAIDKYWQQEFLFHGFPFRIEGSFLHNYFAYLLAYKIWEIYVYGLYRATSGSVTRKNLLDLVAIYSKELDHKMKFISAMVEHTAPFESDPIKLMQVLLRIK